MIMKFEMKEKSNVKMMNVKKEFVKIKNIDNDKEIIFVEENEYEKV
jgi:hypothetical protein